MPVRFEIREQDDKYNKACLGGVYGALTNDIANVRVHDTIKEQPIVRLIEERKVLQELPYSAIKDISIKPTGDVIVPLNFDHQPLHHDLSIYNDYCQVASL